MISKSFITPLILGAGGSLSAVSGYYIFRSSNSSEVTKNIKEEKKLPLIGEYVFYKNGNKQYCYFWKSINNALNPPIPDTQCSELSEKFLEEENNKNGENVRVRAQQEYLKTILEWHNLWKNEDTLEDIESWKAKNGWECKSKKIENVENSSLLEIFVNCSHKENSLRDS